MIVSPLRMSPLPPAAPLTVLLVCAWMLIIAQPSWADGIPNRYRCGGAALQQAVAAAHADHRAPRLLLMSGGGSYGAWGAGFVNGWRANGSAPEPDVITGVSAGAIAATFVFLRDAAGLENIFTKTTNKDFYRKRFMLELLFSNSLFSTSRQKKTLADVFDEDLLAKVTAKAEEKGAPLLCVGTVNLRSGEFVQWNLNQIAIEKEYHLYRKILRASTALPALFPPVELMGDLHADGGTRQNIFATFERIMLLHAYAVDQTVFSEYGIRSPDALHDIDAELIPDLLERAETVLDDTPRATAFIVINGKIDVDTVQVKNKLLPLAMRGLSMLINERLHGNLYRLHYYLHNSEAGDSIATGWQFRFTRIPPHQHLPCAMIDFKPECLRPLYDQAYALQGKWETGFPKMD